MRERFNQELNHLNSDVVRMGSFVESAIEYATETLSTGDEKDAEAVLRMEKEVDRLEQSIEARCLRLLLHEQPVATDLRLVSAALKMVSDMKRIGDQAVNISWMSLLHQGVAEKNQRGILCHMGAITAKMASMAVDAFVARDLDIAQAVIQTDDAVDELFKDVRQALIDLIRSDDSDDAIEAALNYYMIAKYFERMADHTVNIAYWVRYAITGETRGEEKE